MARFERTIAICLATGVAVAALLVAACGEPPGEATTSTPPPSPEKAPAVVRLDPPAGPGAMAPNLWTGDAGVLASWIEPLADDGHRLLAARLEGDVWSEPAEVARGDGFFANWADVPAVVRGADGALVAHWLEKLGPGTYAYGVQLARSDDDGVSWRRLGLLHDDASETEHGFVSWQLVDGGLRAAWLDGRVTAAGGTMQLRSARVGADGATPSVMVDDSVCDCCPTAMAAAGGTPLVAYRGRTGDEIRDVLVARLANGANDGDGGSEPVRVHDDGWEIAGCPVNGPAIAAAGEHVAIAWFTAAAGRPRVQAAFSADGGRSFGPPVLIDGDAPLGRVGLVLDGDAAWVSWLATRDQRGEIRLRRVAMDGTPDPPIVVTATSAARSAGVPRLARDGDRLIVAWVEDGEPSRLRVASIEP